VQPKAVEVREQGQVVTHTFAPASVTALTLQLG